MANLVLKNINKIYPNNVQAVFDFNLEIKDKEFIVFVGPSGCGKSTTLRMVAGLEDITYGDLYIDGELENEVLPKDRDVAMVFQNYALFPHLTVYDNIAFGLKIHKALHPIVESTPELQAIDDKIKLLQKDMSRVNRTFKKKQNDDEVLQERTDLYTQFYLLCDEREKLVKQKVGHYSLGIKIEKGKISHLKSDIRELNSKIKKLEVELQLISDPAVLESIKKEITDYTSQVEAKTESLKNADATEIAKIKKEIRTLDGNISEANNRVEQLQKSLASGGTFIDAYKVSIEKKEAEIKKCEEKIKFYETNEAPLFKIRKDNRTEIELRVNKVADVLDLTKYLYRKPTALSGGQRQRVALGRAIIRNPKVFLMDEPLSNLDAKLRVAMRSEIIKIHKRVGATTIYVTHDQTEAMTMADRIVIMKAGYVQQIGTPTEVYEDPANQFVAGFIGSPAMNFIRVRYSNGIAHIIEADDHDEASLVKSKTKYQKVDIKLNKKDKAILDKFASNSDVNLDSKKETEARIAELTEELNSNPKKEKTINAELAKLNDKLDAINKEIANSKEKKEVEVILGVRPENIYVKNDKRNSNPSVSMNLECDFAELLGYESIIYTYVNGQKLILKTEQKLHIQVHDKIDVCFDSDRLYFFNKFTGARIK